MDFEDDDLSPCLPVYQPSPLMFNPLDTMSQGFDGLFLNHPQSPESWSDRTRPQTNVGNPNSQKPPLYTPTTNAFQHMGSAIASSSQGPSSDSQSNSQDASDETSGDVFPEDVEALPGSITIPADDPDQETSQQSYQGEELFDFATAASSPLNEVHQSKNYAMPFRTHPNGGPAAFPVDASSFTVDEAKNVTRQHTPRRYIRYINGSMLEKPVPMYPDASSFEGSVSAPYSPEGQVSFNSPTLSISPLPKTQRVETQMHVTLTMYPLPPGVNKVHFPSYTMARTKLVIRPPPQRSPSMLEIYAHCVCATAMEDPDKRRQALQRARSMAGHDNGDGHGNSQPRGLVLSEDDPRKPINGGFVSICQALHFT